MFFELFRVHKFCYRIYYLFFIPYPSNYYGYDYSISRVTWLFYIPGASTVIYNYKLYSTLLIQNAN